MEEYKLISVQLSLFSKTNSIKDFNIISTKIDEIWSNKNFRHNILAIPDEAPLDIPRLMTETKEKDFNIQVSKNRVNFITDKIQFISANIPKIYLFLESTINEFGRIGIVFNYFKETNESPLNNLVNLDNNNDLKDIIIRFNNEFDFPIKNRAYKLNNSHTYQDGFIRQNTENKKGVIITIDVNTKPEDLDSLNLTQNDIQEIFNKSTTLANIKYV